MAKKRAREADGQQTDEDDSSSDDEMDMVNVDFELFNYDPDIDFPGVKSLLRQLFDTDAQLVELSGLSDLIVHQNTIGSTCKVDNKANDAYAFLTVLNAREQRAQRPIQTLVQYLAERAGATPELAPVKQLLNGTLREEDAEQPVVGIVLAERLLNMPAEVVPPMWTLLIDEIEAAVEDKEPYNFTHYLVVSRAYREIESSLDEGERKRKKAREETPSLQYFHSEDEALRRHAVAAGVYAYARAGEAVADSRRAFQEMGIQTEGLMMLIEAEKFEAAVKALKEYVGGPF